MFETLFDKLFLALLSSVGEGWFVIIIAFLLSLITTLLYKTLTPQIKFKNLKKEITLLRLQLGGCKGDKIKTEIIQNIIAEKNIKIGVGSIFPNFINMIPILFLFSYFNKILAGAILWGMPWLIFYFIWAIIFSILIKFLIKIY